MYNRYQSVLFFLLFAITTSSSIHANTKPLKPFSLNDFQICYQVTPLMKACQSAYFDEIERLLKAGAIIDVLDDWEFLRGGTSVLGYAVLSDKAAIVDMLLKAGANPNGIINRGVHIEPDIHIRIIPALTYAISHRKPAPQPGGSFEMIKSLIDAGADINAPDPIFNTVTPLIAAAALGQVDTVKYLLNAKVDKSYKNESNKTALDYARGLLQRTQEIIALLEK